MIQQIIQKWNKPEKISEIIWNNLQKNHEKIPEMTLGKKDLKIKKN